MKLLEDRILRDGKVRAGGILKVDAFLNHQMDVELFCQLAKAWHEAFQDDNVTKILTIEASGIGLACIAAQEFGCPVLFAKKTKTKNIDGQVYSTRVASYTHGYIYDVIVAKDYLLPTDRVLLIDDFLANGAAVRPGAPGGRHAGGRGHRRGEVLPARRSAPARGGPAHRVSGPHRVHVGRQPCF